MMPDVVFKSLKPGNIFERGGNKYMVHTTVSNLAGEVTHVGVMPAFSLIHAPSLTLVDAVSFEEILKAHLGGGCPILGVINAKTVLAPE